MNDNTDTTDDQLLSLESLILYLAREQDPKQAEIISARLRVAIQHHVDYVNVWPKAAPPPCDVAKLYEQCGFDDLTYIGDALAIRFVIEGDNVLAVDVKGGNAVTVAKCSHKHLPALMAGALNLAREVCRGEVQRS
jgi:hypothetical protein